MMPDEVIAYCDLCGKPLGTQVVEIWKWVLHPDCAKIVRARLERFAHVIFDMTDEEFEVSDEEDARHLGLTPPEEVEEC